MALAGYVQLKAHGQADRKLVAASSPDFETVMLHESTTDEEGRSSMQHRSEIPLAAGSTVVFEPGGLHLMLMQPQRSLNVGESIPITLQFADGEVLEVLFEVRAR